jgi:hypothetical protein
MRPLTTLFIFFQNEVIEESNCQRTYSMISQLIKIQQTFLRQEETPIAFFNEIIIILKKI